jgi:hemerythrin
MDLASTEIKLHPLFSDNRDEARTMPLLSWKSDYLVGIEQFDEQHRVLIALIHDLDAAIESGQAGWAMDGLLQRLSASARENFAAEEAAMERHGYPFLDIHRKDHRRLTTELTEHLERYRQGDGGVCVSLEQLLCSWVRDHIIGMDRFYTEFLHEQGVW